MEDTLLPEAPLDTETVEQLADLAEDIALAPVVDLLSTISSQLDTLLTNQDILIQLMIVFLALVAAFFVSYAIFRYLK